MESCIEEDLVRIKPFYTGCYDENGNMRKGFVGGGRYIPIGVVYNLEYGFWTCKYGKEYIPLSDGSKERVYVTTEIISNFDMQQDLKSNNPHFKKVSELAISEIKEFRQDYWRYLKVDKL